MKTDRRVSFGEKGALEVAYPKLYTKPEFHIKLRSSTVKASL